MGGPKAQGTDLGISRQGFFLDATHLKMSGYCNSRPNSVGLHSDYQAKLNVKASETSLLSSMSLNITTSFYLSSYIQLNKEI